MKWNKILLQFPLFSNIILNQTDLSGWLSFCPIPCIQLKWNYAFFYLSCFNVQKKWNIFSRFIQQTQLQMGTLFSKQKKLMSSRKKFIFEDYKKAQVEDTTEFNMITTLFYIFRMVTSTSRYKLSFQVEDSFPFKWRKCFSSARLNYFTATSSKIQRLGNGGSLEFDLW